MPCLDFNDIRPDAIHGFKYFLVFALFADDLVGNDFAEVVQKTGHEGVLG